MKMLTLAMVSTLLVSSNAFALSAKDDWSKIRKSWDALILQPNFAGAFGSEGVFNACATDDSFQSLQPIRVCKEYREIRHGNSNSEGGGWIEYRCVNWQTENVEISRTVQQSRCIRHAPINEGSSGGCLEYETKDVQLGKTHKLEVVYARGELYMHHMFFKNYTIPDCE